MPHLRRIRSGSALAIGLLATLLSVVPAAGQTVTLRGFVVDASDDQPMQGANVVLSGTGGRLLGTVTDKDGFYQVGRIPPGRYALRISFIGYRPSTDTLDLGAEPFVTLRIALEPAPESLEEVVVAAEGGAARVEAGRQTVRARDLHRIPTPDAGGDLASYLQALPGVVSLGDRGGQLFIRGGTPAQNLVLLDGQLVYQPFHIIGFFSAFPEDLVSFVDFFAGGFGARYSGRLSSVIDVTTREGNKQAFAGAVSVSPFLSSLRVEGPLRRGRVSMLGSLRRSLIERTAPAFLGESLPFRFGDLFVKLQQTDRYNNRCSLTALHTYDRGRIDTERDDVFRWNNAVFGGRCLAFPSLSPTLFDVNTGVSYVRNAVGNAADPERSSTAVQLNTDINLTRFMGDVTLRGGFFARMNWLRFRLAEQFQNLQEDTRLLFGFGGYVDATISLDDRLEITPGVALVLYPSLPSSVEPRLRAVWRPGGPDGKQAFSAALGVYRQTLAGVSDERDAGSTFIAWMAPPVGDAPARALHAVVGWQHRLAPWLQVATEGYYKRLSRLPVPIWSTIARFTTTLALAGGDVYGADVRAEFQHKSLYGYVGYGYAWTEYRAAQDAFGRWFGEAVQRYHPPHDRRHQVNALLSASAGRFTMSVRWQYGSGLPFTRPLGFDELLPLDVLPDVRALYGTPRVLYEKPYRGRLPTYHRLDLSVERAFPLRVGTLTVQAGILNVYDRANLFYFDLFTLRRVDQLPFIPSVSLKLET